MTKLIEKEYLTCDCCEGEGEHELGCTYTECEKCQGEGEICANCLEFHSEDEECEE